MAADVKRSSVTRCCPAVTLTFRRRRRPTGSRPRLQPSHDPVGHGEDEGVPAGSGDADGSDVPDREGLPELARPEAHLAAEHGRQAQHGEAHAQLQTKPYNYLFRSLLAVAPTATDEWS